MKIKKNDNVLIIKGKDRNKTGKVLRVFPKENRALVEGCNLKKKHIRARREGEKGQIVEVPGPLPISNLKLICPRCKKPTRVGFKIDAESKRRHCKRCGELIDK